MEKSWYALKVHACCERKAEGLLRNYLFVDTDKVEVETFLPVQKEFRNQATGQLEHNRIVIDGLLFVCIAATSKLVNAIRNTPYVIDFYHKPSTHSPAAIPAEQMERLQQILNDAPSMVELVGSIQKGDTVLVTSGKLEGLVGTVMEDETGNYICVAIDILGQYVRTHINKSELAKYDAMDKTAEQTLKKRLSQPDACHLLTSIKTHYEHLTSFYPSQYTDRELCDLVRFYRVLLLHPHLLTVLKGQLWKDNRYGYQHFFAEVYSELAKRVKGTRQKEDRAPLLHALHCLCNQVSLRAYTRKTNVKWVQDCIARTNAWYLRHKSSANDYAFVRLLMDVPLEEEALVALTAKAEKWSDELSDEAAAQVLSPRDVAERLQLLADYAAVAPKGKTTRKMVLLLVDSLSEGILSWGNASDAILLLEALATLQNNAVKVAKSSVFTAVRQSLPAHPISLSAICLRSIIDLYVLGSMLSATKGR